MDRDSGSQPLLRRTSSSSRERKRSGSGRLSLSRRNSVNALRHEFVSKLPEKVLAGIDAEAPFDVDTSKTIALSEGIAACSLLVFVGGLFGWWENEGKWKRNGGLICFLLSLYYKYIYDILIRYQYIYMVSDNVKFLSPCINSFSINHEALQNYIRYSVAYHIFCFFLIIRNKSNLNPNHAWVLSYILLCSCVCIYI